MDVETTQAIDELGSGIDRLESSLRGEIADLRTELRGEIAGLRTELRSEMAGLRDDVQRVRADVNVQSAWMRDELALNWSRTQLLFESVRSDIKLLGEANGGRSKASGRRLKKKKPRDRD